MKKSVMALLATATLLGGCAQPINYGGGLHGIENAVTNFGASDLEKLSSSMVDKMLASAAVRSITASGEPIVVVDSIKNQTRSHVDTNALTAMISERLQDSGKFRFVDPARVKAVRKQLHFSQDDRFVNQSTAIQFGNMVGAQYMLYGHVSTVMKSTSNGKQAYYKMTMRLMDLKSGTIEWSGQDQIIQASAINSAAW
ncbi:penicillin-binding protein activator LpoB [Photobacterium aquimaris]|uniref:Penicillin-binding protein activator LpoB n=1 Tax=Photobacterium aquimaris TaxID=512643 RepID=A0A1B8I5R6_9GAMM|nr:penicillin-binding protein activator LpoB [Photobacterium aquimaris]MCP4957389.1 penicillin-binding protein activator LpoB [Photobacterium aquimaris]OBU26466.1 penicillin-binding protein activator LpoB [Photobacterium aquimaris]PQJ40786.1 penicillin-binding protein activator LpoB [Photobacterium aquimaris]PSU12148.1 penicillin-binding protein activator LpoB [Photobacterium aquimaris]SMY15201.1 Penicillin-binding protein activator LpoB precursor [Photobacterium aquimaris]